MILDLPRVEYYLSMAQELGRARPLYDVHVSPYEVIFCEFQYRPNAAHAGVYSLGDSDYQAARAGPLRIEDGNADDRLASRREVPKSLSMMMMRKQYAHIGPRVLADQMALSGIGRSLLIPVLRRDSDADEQRRLMFDVYGGDARFGFAYCPPRPVDEAGAVADLRRAASERPLRAIKVNPNIQGIDISTDAGRQRLEHLIAAARATALPMIVHGGISRLLPDPRCQAFAALDRLLSVEWRRAAVPVVICHAGMFGCASCDVVELVPTLGQLLRDNDNVLVDISGLSVGTLSSVLGQIDHDRIVFGSDALYFPQWSAVVKLLYAMDQLGLPVEQTFVKLAGINPERRLFGEDGWMRSRAG